MEFLFASGARMRPRMKSTHPDRYPIPEIVIGNLKANVMMARIGRASRTPNKQSKKRNMNWIVFIVPNKFIGESGVTRFPSPTRMMFLDKIDQVTDLRRAAIVKNYASIIAPKHLVNFAEDDSQIRECGALFEWSEMRYSGTQFIDINKEALISRGLLCIDDRHDST